MKAKNYTKETIASLGMFERKFPKFEVGDSIVVAQRIQEGGKERIQLFQGDVIAIRNKAVSSTFTVRKIAANAIAVERIYPYYSPMIESIQVVRKGKVRRAKLYYLRDRLGKAARIPEKIQTRAQKEASLLAHAPIIEKSSEQVTL